MHGKMKGKSQGRGGGKREAGATSQHKMVANMPVASSWGTMSDFGKSFGARSDSRSSGMNAHKKDYKPFSFAGGKKEQQQQGGMDRSGSFESLGSGGQTISSTFFLSPTPSPPTLGMQPKAVNTSVLPEVVQSSSFRQALIALQRKIENGSLKGVKLEKLDLNACRCIVLCHDDQYGKPGKFNPDQIFIDREKENLCVRMLITFIFRSSDIHQTAVPQFDFVPGVESSGTRTQKLMDYIRHSVNKLSLKRAPNNIETVLRFVVSQLNNETLNESAYRRQVRDRTEVRNPNDMFQMDLSEQEKNNQPGLVWQKQLSSKKESSSTTLSASGVESNNGTNTEYKTSSVQPCPRFSGATFSGPGLLVYFNSGIDDQLRLRQSHLRQNDVDTVNDPTNRKKKNKNDDQHEEDFFPRTFDELRNILKLRQWNMKTRGKLSRTMSDSSEEDTPYGQNAQGDDIGIAEDLTPGDLYDWDLRITEDLSDKNTLLIMKKDAGASILSANGTQVEQELPEKNSAQVSIMDISLISPVQRFLGKVCRIGKLDSITNRALSKNLDLDTMCCTSPLSSPGVQNSDRIVPVVFHSDGSRAEEDIEDSYESLLCWYDDFSDEPTHDLDCETLGKANMLACRTVGRFDLVQLWLYMCMINNMNIARYESSISFSEGVNNVSESWALHPCGRNFLDKLFKEYANMKDVQTLAIVSCVLEDQSKLSDWENTIPLMNPQWKPGLNRQRIAYANLLHQWGLNIKRAEIMKYCGRDSDGGKLDKLQLAPVCPQCGEISTTDLACIKPECRRKGILLTCVICHVGVKGLCTFCPVCGHGGHAAHMKEWFQNTQECPTGCGCLCGQEI
mmetsp:Transcript_39695/g.64423  ORF Transcript_39695/g.64423 Transcript_39695/m.64423 type:complete len:844 (-) Transcript_39695:960-3491(-)